MLNSTAVWTFRIFEFNKIFFCSYIFEDLIVCIWIFSSISNSFFKLCEWLKHLYCRYLVSLSPQPNSQTLCSTFYEFQFVSRWIFNIFCFKSLQSIPYINFFKTSFIYFFLNINVFHRVCTLYSKRFVSSKSKFKIIFIIELNIRF